MIDKSKRIIIPLLIIILYCTACSDIHSAAYNGDIESVEELLNDGEDINEMDEEGNTLLHIAVLKGDVRLVKLLVEKGADVNIESKSEMTSIENTIRPLCLAAYLKNYDIVKVLVENKADVNAKNGVSKITALHWSARKGEFKITELLIKNGADVNACTGSGITPLSDTALNNKNPAKIAKLLLKHGADPNIDPENVFSALKYAYIHGNVELVELLKPLTKKKLEYPPPYIGIDYKRNVEIGIDHLSDIEKEEKYRSISIPLAPYFVKTTLNNTKPVKLRSTYKSLTNDDVKKFVKKYNFQSKSYNKEGCFANIFVDNDDGTISDLRTGLMWQKAGSPEPLNDWDEIEDYVKELNASKFAGYDDWRLPTAEEGASLITKYQSSSGVHIDYLFKTTIINTFKCKYNRIWTGDLCGKAIVGRWIVAFSVKDLYAYPVIATFVDYILSIDFIREYITPFKIYQKCYIKCVRSIK